MQRQSRLIACLVLVLGCDDVEGENVEDSCVAQLGESCFDRPCVDGAICYAEQDLCIEGLQLGENCGGTIPCAVGLACDADSRDCVAAPEVGEPCMGHPQCASGYCPAGFCKPLPEKGEACFDKCTGGLACLDRVCKETVGSSCD